MISSSGIPSASVRPSRLYQTLYHPNNPSNATDTQSPTDIQRVFECSLHNASYKVAFNLHSNGQQGLTADRTLLNPGLCCKLPTGRASNHETSITVIERFNYQALDTLGMLVKERVVIEPDGEKITYRIIPQSRP